MRVKFVYMASGTDASQFDMLRANTNLLQLPAYASPHIQMDAPVRLCKKKTMGIGRKRCSEERYQILAHLITAGAKARTHPYQEVGGVAPIRRVHHLHHFLRNSLYSPFPSGMSQTNGVVFGINIGNGEAVGNGNKQRSVHHVCH